MANSLYFRWYQNISSIGRESATSVALGKDGSIYVVGETSDNLAGNNNNGGAFDAFVSKFDSAGNNVWTNLLGSSDWDTASDVLVALDGSLYVSGLVSGKVNGINSAGSTDGFLAKYSASGELNWVRLLGGSGADSSGELFEDGNGRIYIINTTAYSYPGNSTPGDYLSIFDRAGKLITTSFLGLNADSHFSLMPDGTLFRLGKESEDAIFAKYDIKGQMLWERTIGSIGVDEATCLTTDLSGNVYVAGITYGNLKGYSNQGSEDIFLAKLSPTGAFEWTRTIGTKGTDHPTSITFSPNGLICLSGYRSDSSGSDALLFVYNSAGDQLDSVILGKSSSDFSFGVAASADEDVVIVGKSNFDDAFVARYSFKPAPGPATYSLVALTTNVVEGSSASFLLSTDNIDPGTLLTYKVSDISASDITGGMLSGNVSVGADGSALISLSIARDGIDEIGEKLTLQINDQSAQINIIDDNSLLIQEVIVDNLEKSIYKTSKGTHILSTSGLDQNDIVSDYHLLKTSSYKNYVPKGATAIFDHEDGSFSLISQKILLGNAKYNEQKFSADGIALGKAAKLTTGQLLSKEMLAEQDINGDGVVGEVVGSVLDGDGDSQHSAYGLYKTVAGTIVIGVAGLEPTDLVGTCTPLMSTVKKDWVTPVGAAVVGIAFTDDGSLEVLTLKGSVYKAREFDPLTGLVKGLSIAVKADQLEAREYYYNLDLNGDGEVSLVGQETPPVGWAV